MAWWNSKKKKTPGYSYFAGGVTLEGRLCFNGIIRLDGRIIGEIVSSETLVVEETALISGDVMVENIILSGTVYGDIRAYKHVQLNASARVYGHISYGELSIEGAVHEGSSHKLSAEEVAAMQQECAEILQEAEADLERSRPSSDDLAQYASAMDHADREASSALLRAKGAKKQRPDKAKTAPAEEPATSPEVTPAEPKPEGEDPPPSAE